MESSVLSVLVFLAGVCQGSSPVTCSSPKTACEAHQDNTLGTFLGVASLEECRVMCRDNADCRFLTYYYEEGPVKQFCFLFSSCQVVVECQACVSETYDCGLRCDAPFSGVLAQENTLGEILDVKTTPDCREYCRSRTGCRFYSYYDSPGSVFYQMCFLLSHLMEPYQHSEGVITGPVQCDETFSSLCTMRIGGESLQSFVFTDVSDVSNVQLIGNNNCKMKILAVGGGGAGSGSYVSGGHGGGSGFIEITNQDIPLGVHQLAVSVGTYGNSSNVTVNGNLVLEAVAGGDAGGGCGGDGYSGGSFTPGVSATRGGSDGSDGSGACGGGGTGEDVRKFSSENFLLTPGTGGYFSYGGGAGGVLVNGGGPVRDNEGQGEGYGGGGEGGGQRGLPGFVIIELGRYK